ncbi:MAG: hypothetical protein HMLKMBBP_00225 [Planctomycetes bacterium]|nr:hypothetical protein [Planctomycetota bacterium]
MPEDGPRPDAPNGSETSRELGARIAQRYAADRRLLSFDRLLDLFLDDPYPLSRSAVQTLRDAIRSFGTEEVPGIGGPVRRWRIFDAPWDGGVGALSGQEEAQAAVVEAVDAAAREGRLDRMIVLSGPNGSGKSSLIELLQRGLEEYSHAPEGAAYALRWIFPKEHPEGASLGFGGKRRADGDGSFASLPPDEIAGRLVCEMRDNPLFVIPDSEREAMLAAALARNPARRAESYRAFLTGNLCPKCKTVYEGLLASAQGDWRQVVRHVQAERVFVSRRFRVGAVVVQPQGTVDAALQPIAGGGAQGLPRFLSGTPLFEVIGDLPDANRGLLEFSDFLKRSLELGKYLLQTTERGFVTVGNQLLEIDAVFMATVNERHLEAFRQSPEFASFQGRMHFVRVPYLREFGKELRIYGDLAKEIARGRHTAPHLAETLAFFAVLTRLERPQREKHEGRLRSLAHDLAPAEKLWLYADGRAPDRLSADEARMLRRAIPELRDEHRFESRYEGRVGASVRDLRASLLKASVRREGGCLTHSAVVDALRDLIREKATYRFLQVEPDGEYHDAEALLAAAKRELGARIAEDVQEAMALVARAEYDRRFDAYFQHVIAEVRREGVRDPATGRSSDPDRGLMEGVEKMLEVRGDAAAWRSGLVSRIGAWAVDHPGEGPPDMRAVFPDLFRNLRKSFFKDRRAAVERVQRNLLALDTPDAAAIPEAERAEAVRTMDRLCADRGYCRTCARDAVDFALAGLVLDP